MTDEDFTREQMDTQRQEVSRLRSELKAFNNARAQMSKEEKEQTREQAKEMQDKYNRALGRLYTMKNYFRWNQCIGREYASVCLDD